jgi:predicted DNA-binding transcriptional regulator YafY
VRIDAERARWACEKPFHPRQRVRRQADGGVVLEIERAWDAEMMPQLLALGSHAEVLEPADVREAIAAEAGRIAARYTGRGLRSVGARSVSG